MNERENWIKGYQEYTSESESPSSFHLWIALSVIASAVKRNVWLHQGHFITYPNLYVVLIAEAGKCRKSSALRLGNRLLVQVPDMNIGPDSVTREELVRYMATTTADGQSAVTLHSTELSSLIEPSGIKTIQFLTDIYDCASVWKYATKSSGRDTIVNPVLNVLAATTPSWISEGFPEQATAHGLTSRTLFVYEQKIRDENPFPKEPSMPLVQRLIDDLIHISRIEGRFQWANDAIEVYKEIYHDIVVGAPVDHRIQGYYNRKQIHVLKVAMLLSLADSDDLILTEKYIAQAMAALEDIEANMPQTFSAVGRWEMGADLERILDRIRFLGKVTAEQIIRENYSIGGLEGVMQVIMTLIKMGEIKQETIESQTWLYPAGEDFQE